MSEHNLTFVSPIEWCSGDVIMRKEMYNDAKYK